MVEDEKLHALLGEIYYTTVEQKQRYYISGNYKTPYMNDRDKQPDTINKAIKLGLVKLEYDYFRSPKIPQVVYQVYLTLTTKGSKNL